MHAPECVMEINYWIVNDECDDFIIGLVPTLRPIIRPIYMSQAGASISYILNTLTLSAVDGVYI
jgi:hypothetical protein